MSHNTNTNLIERANELREEVEGSNWAGQLDLALAADDLEHLYSVVESVERYLRFRETVNDDYPEVY